MHQGVVPFLVLLLPTSLQAQSALDVVDQVIGVVPAGEDGDMNQDLLVDSGDVREAISIQPTPTATATPLPSPTPKPGDEFVKRSNHSANVFQGRQWVIGGGTSEGFSSGVLSSTNGSTWNLETAAAQFPPRVEHTSLVFSDKLWVIGGRSSAGFHNDVWSSSDGVKWDLATASADFEPRGDHSSVVFNGRMWVVGGTKFVDPYYREMNDVWSSADGVDWTLETGEAGFSPRSGHTSLVFDDRIWIIGGLNAFAIRNRDVWSSVDGINWVNVTSTAQFAPRDHHTSAVFNNRMWVIGGLTGIFFEPPLLKLNDVWSSSNGIQWELVQAFPPFTVRENHSTVVHDGKLWVVGGFSTGLLNDVWSSPDGITWTKTHPLP